MAPFSEVLFWAFISQGNNLKNGDNSTFLLMDKISKIQDE